SLGGVATASELLAAGDELGPLALDRDRLRLAGPDEIADVGFLRGEGIGRDLEPAALALRGAELRLGLRQAPRRGLALRAELHERALGGVELLAEAPVHRGEAFRRLLLRRDAVVGQTNKARRHD